MRNTKPLYYIGIFILFIHGQCFAESTMIEVDYNHLNKSLSVEQCFIKAPAYFKSNDDQVIKLTKQMKWRDQAIYYKRGYVRISGEGPGCLHYKISTLGLSNQSQKFKKQHPDSLLLGIDSWLWQSSNHKHRDLPQVKINHPSHIKVSAPWKLINRTNLQTHYQIKPTPKYADGYMAFGPLEMRNIQLGDSILRLAILSGNHLSQGDMIEQWITQMAESVARVGQSFPLKEIQVLVILVNGQGRSSVPWGQVNRAGGQGVLFVVNATHDKKKLFSDWTAAHEFSHLLTPYTPNDRWLSEGFASYHQNISRLRTGLLDEKTAWSKLVAGFDRGQKSAAKRSAPNLKQASNKHNMQLYWGGAVIALKADVILQEQTQGQMNLTKALAGLQNCCLDTGKGWAARDLFIELDKITNTDVFMNLYDLEVNRNPYPKYQQLLKDLGIEKNYYGEIVLNDKAPKAHIRERISSN